MAVGSKGGLIAIVKVPVVMIQLVFICTFLGSTAMANERCSIPEKWNGEWFISDFTDNPPVRVDSSNGFIKRHGNRQDYFSNVLGQCILNRGDYYVFRDPVNKCSKCIFLVEKHENVLYSTEAIECLMDTQWDQDDIETICNRLHGHHESNYYYWFRKDYKPIDCPFRNSSFKFSYRTPNGRKCESPISHSSTCLDRSTTELEYQACHDHDQTEWKVEIMTCIGRFDRQSDGEYLVADVTRTNDRVTRPLRDRLRCYFVKEQTIPNSVPSKPAVVTGYHIGVSGGPTCKGLLPSPETGHTVLYFERDEDNVKDENTKLCSFPSWLTSQTWQSFGRSIEFKTDPQERNATIHIIPRNPNNDPWKGEDKVMQRRQSFFPLTRSQLQCIHKMERNEESASSDDDHFVFVGKYTVDCKIDYICMHFVRRSDSIFQVYYESKEPTLSREEFRQRCFDASLPSLFKGITMFNPDSFNGEACPSRLQGKYSVTNLILEENIIDTDADLVESLALFQSKFNRLNLEVGCSSPYLVDVNMTDKNNTVHLNCSSLRWEADDVQYLLLNFVIPSKTEQSFICLAQSNKPEEMIGEGKPKNKPAIFLSTKDCLHFNLDRFADDFGAFKGEESGNSNGNSYEGRTKMEKFAGCPNLSKVEVEGEHENEAPLAVPPDTSSSDSFSSSCVVIVFVLTLSIFV